MAMHPARKRRAQIIVFMLLAVAIATGLMLYALRDNINLFYPPADIAAGKAQVGQNIRAGGMVREGSIVRTPGSLNVNFVVTDYEADLTVKYDGILPDLFAEGAGVVVAGQLNEQGEFIASEVLAKHDENYMPPEVAETLKKDPGKVSGASSGTYNSYDLNSGKDSLNVEQYGSESDNTLPGNEAGE